MPETLRISTDDRGVTRLTLARAEKHNALSAEMIADLTEAADRLGRDPAVRVVVLDADGSSFCAGGDLGWMREQMSKGRPAQIASARALAQMLAALNALPKPLVGRIHGAALGGGVGLAAVCDVAVGADGVSMGLTETRLGLIPATIAPYVISRIGEAGARRVMLSGRRFDAAEARDIGLLARVVPDKALDQAVEDEVAPYMTAAPGAVAAAKALIRRLGTPIDESVIAETIEALTARWASDEAQDGIAAFFDKRPPPWG